MKFAKEIGENNHLAIDNDLNHTVSSNKRDICAISVILLFLLLEKPMWEHWEICFLSIDVLRTKLRDSAS